jgi:hypothetical protein
MSDSIDRNTSPGGISAPVRRWMVVGLLLGVIPLLLPFFLPPSAEPAGGWLVFAGRFHPLLVHFPIALVPVACAFDLAAARRAPTLEAAVPILVGLGAVSALVAFALGILLARGEGTTGVIVSRHYCHAARSGWRSRSRS